MRKLTTLFSYIVFLFHLTGVMSQFHSFNKPLVVDRLENAENYFQHMNLNLSSDNGFPQNLFLSLAAFTLKVHPLQ